jgi:hypothetical protein
MPTAGSQLPANASWIRRSLADHDRAIRELRGANGVRSFLGNATALQSQPISATTPADRQVLSYVEADGAWEPVALESLDSIHVIGLQADGRSDDAPAIQATLDALDTSGQHSYEVVVEGGAGAVVYINSTVQISTSRVMLRFGSPVLYGPLGRVRIFGELEETPATNKPTLLADALTGATTISVTDVTPFSVGDYIVIRGEHDASGGTLQRMYNVITGISGSVLTLEDPLDDDYLMTYPTSAWPNDATRVTRTTSSMLSTSAARGDRIVTVVSSTSFAVGDWVNVLDNSNTHDSDGTVQTSDFTHREITQVAEIVSGTQIRLTGALHHPYLTGQRARVAKILPVVRSIIEGAFVTWPGGLSAVGNAFEIQYGVNCAIRDCVAAGGTSGSWLNHAFRQTNSWGCAVEDCTAYGPQDTSSGRGYGATLYGATACTVRGFRGVSLRHTVLFFNGAAGNLVTDCLSQDVRISDFDFHGAECVDNLVTGGVVVGGDSLPTDQPSGVRKAACKAGNPSHVEGDFFNTFSDMLIVNYGYNTGGGSALDVVAASANTVFRNSRVVNAAMGVTIVVATNTTLVAGNTRVLDVDFEDVPTVLNVNGGSSDIVQGFALEDCRIVRPTVTLQVQNAQRVTIRGCTWIDPALGTTDYAITGSNITALAIRGNDMSGTGRGIKLGTCPSARVTGNTLHDLTGDGTVYEDQGGNDATLFRGNDIWGTTPILRTSGTGPSPGGLATTGMPYVADHPFRHGWQEWNYDPIGTGTGTGQTLSTGILYVLKISAQGPGPVSNAIVNIGSTSATMTLAQVALYDDSGAQLAVSGDQSVSWSTSGIKIVSLGTSVTLKGGRDYFIGVLGVGSAPAALVRGSATNVVTPNAGLGNAVLRFATNGSGLSAMPSTLTLGSNVGTGAQTFWIALS